MRNVKNRIKRAALLNAIVAFKSIKEAARQFKKSPSALYRMRDRLVKGGFLNPDFSLTTKGLNLIKESAIPYHNIQRRNVIRLHNVAVVAKILVKPLNWVQRREKWSESFGGRTWKTVSGVFAEVKVSDWLRVRATPSSVVLYFGEVWAENPRQAKNKLFDLTASSISRVERMLGIRLHKRYEFVCRTTQQEFGFVNNELAESLINGGFKSVRVEDMNGEPRVIVDDSKGFGELETVHPVHGEEDAVKLKGLIEDVVLRGHSLSELSYRIDAIAAQLNNPEYNKSVERREVG